MRTPHVIEIVRAGQPREVEIARRHERRIANTPAQRQHDRVLASLLSGVGSDVRKNGQGAR